MLRWNKTRETATNTFVNQFTNFIFRALKCFHMFINLHSQVIPSFSPLLHYPHAFLKKRRGYCDPLRPSVRPLCYLLLNHWTKFNQNWCVSYSHEWGAQRKIFFLAPPTGALGRGQKVKYHLISITKSISKIFIPNFVCVLTNERYKTYQTGFLFCCLGHALGVGLGGT